MPLYTAMTGMRRGMLYTGICVSGLENDVLHRYQLYTAAHTICARNLGARFIAHGAKLGGSFYHHNGPKKLRVIYVSNNTRPS